MTSTTAPQLQLFEPPGAPAASAIAQPAATPERWDRSRKIGARRAAEREAAQAAAKAARWGGDLSDLDMRRARRILSARTAHALAASSCRCSHPLVDATLDEDADRCTLCGRTVIA